MRMIVGLVFVNMVNMQAMPPSFAAFFAKLAGPFITILDLFAEPFPVRSVFPFCNTAFPCWIVWPAYRATQNQGISQRATLNFMLIHGLYDRALIDAHVVSDLLNGTQLIDVFGTKPFSIVIQLLRAIVTRNIMQPLAFLANPFCFFSASTSAKRSIANWLIGRLARTSFSCLSGCTAFVSMATQEITHVPSSAVKSKSGFSVGGIEPILLTGPVILTNCNLGFFVV